MTQLAENRTQLMINRLRLAVHSFLAERMRTAGMVGLQFAGKRDIYEAAGYDRVITAKMLSERYNRQDVAQRIVNAPADETWRLSPMILDGATVETAEADSDFVQAWNRLATGGAMRADGGTSIGLLHYLHRLDRLAGVGCYGVMHLGIRGDENLSMPLAPAKRSTDDLLYVSVYEERLASISSMVQDRNSMQFGLPGYYQLTTETGVDGTALKYQLVHWNRVLHVADGLRSDDIFGTPRLVAVWPRLLDLEKIMAGAGEGAWKLLDPGHLLTTKDGARLPSNPDDIEALEDQVDEWIHGLRRWILGENLESQSLGGQMTDPGPLVMTELKLISVATSIPLRILLGTEEGKLAGSQDERGWVRVIETRQQNFAWPLVLRPLINRLIWLGILPKPKSGDFCCRWPNLLDKDRKEEAETADKVASALQKAKIQVEPGDFVRAYLPDLASARVSAVVDGVAAVPPVANRRVWTNAMTLRLDPPDDGEEEARIREAEAAAARQIEEGLRQQLEAVTNGQGEGGVVAADQVEERLARHDSILRRTLEEALNAGLDLGVRMSVEQLGGQGISFNWRMVHTLARQWANEYSFELIRGINETSAGRVRQALDRWIASGEPLAALRNALEPDFGSRRAMLIAQTETTRAYAEGTLRGYRASGVVEMKEWLTANDELVCPVCGGLHARRVALDAEFPGLVGVPPAHPGCRCRIRGVLTNA